MHPNDLRWLELSHQIDRLIAQQDCHPARCVVLVPYAQLIPLARKAWLEREQPGQSAFVPRIESTQTWAEGLWARQGGYAPAAGDFTGDPACDQVAAWQWLDEGGLGAYQDELGPKLIEAAQSLSRQAAAVEPSQRPTWAAGLRTRLTEGMDAPALRLEASLAQIALAWVSASGFMTDVLFGQEPPLLVVVEGWQADPLVRSLLARQAERAVSLSLADTGARSGQIALHACQDREDEAARAAACVLAHLSEGRQPVALIAQDRALTRRVGALLATRHVNVRDETGWTLSTTRAAATVMALLRAARRQASCDEVLTWLKQLPSVQVQGLLEAESQLRRGRVRLWKDLGAAQPAALALQSQVGVSLQRLQAARPLQRWLEDLRQSLRDGCLWDDLCADAAGQAVIRALWLDEDPHPVMLSKAIKLSQRVFIDWVAKCLESSTFTPVHPPQAQVMMLPLGQMLGRSPAAVVFAGADERHLPACPPAPGPWTSRQRQVLGLPSRHEQIAAQRKAWGHLLQTESVDLLWRCSENGETVMPAPFVQELRLAGHRADGTDPREHRSLKAAPVRTAQVDGRLIPVGKLSASSYEDLRACPYRFFALRQLGLAPAEELDGLIDARDLGLWLHAALRFFHELELERGGPLDTAERVEALDRAAQRAMDQAGLDPIQLLPNRAAWPVLRDAYLNWLALHEGKGHRFEAAEAWHELPFEAAGLELVGKIDRIDRDSRGRPVLVDYKIEGKDKTRARIKRPTEDTQLAFYAALRPEDDLSAMYLGLSDRGEMTEVEQSEIGVLRDLLRQGVLDDLGRMREGEPLVALGQGQSCQYCQARGLCRRDFVWAQSEPS